MRERSKKAARTRREKENHEFIELAKLLPLPGNVTSQLDKATVVKLTTAYLKLRELYPYGLGAPWGSAPPEALLKDLASFLLQALEGFLVIVGPNAKIIYISEGVSFYLGLSQVEMMGNNINEYIHACDQAELEALLNHEEIVHVDSRILEEVEVARSFSLRMKCVLTKRSAGLVTDNYKLIYCRGYQKLRPIRLGAAGVSDPLDVRYSVAGLVAVGNALHPTSILELKMYSRTFMFRAELDLKFLHIDPRAQDSIGYESNHLLYKSFYKFVHVCDCFKIREDHSTLISKGQAVTGYYRFLTLSGGWVWMQSSFILLLNSKSRQTFVLAINHVISDCEHDYCIMAEEQAANGELNFCKKNCLPSEPPECSKSMPKKKKKKTKPTSNSCPDSNSLGQHDTLTADFQNSGAPLQFSHDPRLFTYSLPSSESNDFTLNIQDQSSNSSELFANPIRSINHGQPNVPIESDISNRCHPFIVDQCCNKAKPPMVNFQFQIRDLQNQSVNMADSPTSPFRPMTYNPLVSMEENSTNYFQTFTSCQTSNGGRLEANNFLPATCSQFENKSFACNLQSIARSNSRHLCDSSAKDLKPNWIANGHISNSCLPEDTNKSPFHLNEFSSTSALNVSESIHNSFLTTINPPLCSRFCIPVTISSKYPELNSNHRVSYPKTLECPGTIDSISTGKSSINICSVDDYGKRKQNADSYKHITQNSFTLASNYDAFVFNYTLQNLSGDTEIDSNTAKGKSSAVRQKLNDLTENLKNKENFASVFDHCKMSAAVEKHYFSETGNLEIEPHAPHNNQFPLIKIENDKYQTVSTEDSLSKNIAFNSLNTHIIQTDSPNISLEEIPNNWLNCDDFNNTCCQSEPLEIKSEGASSVISSNGQSPHSTKRDFSFSSDGCNEENFPTLYHLENHTSGYSEQSYNGNSESYFVQSRSGITNSSDSSFGHPFFTNSSSTPLYTVL